MGLLIFTPPFPTSSHKLQETLATNGGLKNDFKFRKFLKQILTFTIQMFQNFIFWKKSRAIIWMMNIRMFLYKILDFCFEKS